MWIVQLQYHGSSWNPVNPSCRTVCACESEEAAHKVGQDLAWFYNNPYLGFQDHLAGVLSETCFNQQWSYAVRQHEGEWV